MVSLVGTRFPPAVEADFQRELGPEKVRVTRQTCLLGCGLFASFAALDVWAIPSALGAAWTIRALVVAMMAAIGALTWRPTFLRYYAPLEAAVYLGGTLGIDAMIALAGPTDLAKTVYYAGLVLVAMALYAWTYLDTWLTVAIGATLVATYVSIAVVAHGMHRPPDWPILLAQAFFLVGANVIGVVARHTRDRYARENYRLRHRLERDLAAEERARRLSEHRSQHDVLTGLPNRVHFARRMDELIAGAREHDTGVAVLFIDLDGFKLVNDSVGHTAGDAVLQVVAGRLSRCVRSSDVLARLAGDEFVVGLEIPSGDRSVADRIARTIHAWLDEEIAVVGRSFRLTASIGIAFYPLHGASADAVLAAADRGMYEVKRGGRAGTRVAPLPGEPRVSP